MLTPARALIAIQFDQGSQVVHEISFTSPISGLAALQLTGIPVETYDFGGGYAVCSINGVGCPADNCFCDPTHFWNYEYWDGSAWQGYMVGAGQSSISDGALEGWRWAEWGVGSLPAAPQLLAAQSALDWLATQQSSTDGGYGSVASSVESLLAIGANGFSASDWRYSPASPVLMSFILGKASAYAQLGASNSGKLASGLSAAGTCWPSGAKSPVDYYSASTGQFENGAGPQSWAILGAVALGETIPVSATNYLKGLQKADGGWEWIPGGFGSGTDTNTTALALQALLSSGEQPTATQVISGFQYLDTAQNDDGGFPYDPDSLWGTDSDANSTAYVIQAIYAAGDSPDSWTISASDPISYLLGLQLANGSFEWQAGIGASLFATQRVIPALLGRAYPLAIQSLPACPTVFLPLVSNSSGAK